MWLQAIRVRNFRAIREASQTFEPDITLLIGEDDCGKSSLLGALGIALGAAIDDDDDDAGTDDDPVPRLGARHFHVPDDDGTTPKPAGPIGIEVAFLERRAGECDDAPLAGRPGAAPPRHRRVRPPGPRGARAEEAMRAHHDSSMD